MCILIVFTLVCAVSKSQIQSISDVSDWDPWSIPSASNNLTYCSSLYGHQGILTLHAIYFCMLLAIGRSASNVQPALINMNELDLGNSRIHNSVSSHSAAASGTEEEPSRRHSGTRYRTPPPPPPYSSSSWLCHSPGFCWYSTNEWYMLYGPPTDREEAHIHTQHQTSLIMHQMIIKAPAAVLPRLYPGTDWAFGALCLI